MDCRQKIVGIDFGTHKTLVARWDEEIGRPVLVRLRPAHGDDMPSAVHVDKDGNITFGDEALEIGLTDPDGLQRSFKRDLGKNAAPYLLHAFEYTPEELTARYLRWIRMIVEEHCLHGPIEEAVFTVPVSWLPSSREALVNAAGEAGFGDIELLEEPVAAGIAFLSSRKDLWPEGEILVFDWGAGTLDLAILKHGDGEPKVVPDLTGGNPNIGGDDVDRNIIRMVNLRLAELSLAKLEQRSAENLEAVRRAVIDWKIKHSTKPEQDWYLPTLTDSQGDSEVRLTGTELWLRVEEKIKGAIDEVGELLTKATAAKSAPQGILLVGGSSQFPSLPTMLRSRFPSLEVFTWDHRISAVALGAISGGSKGVGAQQTNEQSSRPSNPYVAFQQRRDHLLSLLNEAEASLMEIDMHSSCNSLGKLTDRLKSERFRVLVLGEFKRGKSTFINSLLGSEILPAFATPCTAIINELKWGPQAKAVLHFKNPIPAELPTGLPQETLQHLRMCQEREAKPLSIPIDQLERYVSIPDPSKDQSTSIAETPYDRVEIYWPLELLKNSVEIIDSPGLNEHGSRTKITMDYMSHADAVIFVFSVHAMASQTELNVVDHDVRGAGHEYIFFICNRFDEIRRQEDRERVSQYSIEQLAHRTAFGKKGVYFVSALDAVIGQEENNPDLLIRSNIPLLEQHLASFLACARGRIKLLQPARQLEQTLEIALGETIPNQRRMLDQDLTDLQRKSNEAHPKLAETEHMRANLVDRLRRARNRIKESVRDSASIHLRAVADRVPSWSADISIENRVNALKVWTIEAQVESIAAEVLSKISPLIEEATLEWRETRLRSLIEDALADYTETAEISVNEFMTKLEHVRADLAGLGGTPQDSETAISSVERVLSGVGGFVLGGAGSAIEGAALGYKGMLKGLAPQIALSVGAIAIFHLNPITIVPALLAMGLLRTASQGDRLTEKVKVEAAREIAKALVSQISEQAEAIANAVHDSTEGLENSISSGLNDQIEAVREQIATVLDLKRAGEEKVEKRRARLDTAEESLKSIRSNLQEFIIRVSRVNAGGDV